MDEVEGRQFKLPCEIKLRENLMYLKKSGHIQFISNERLKIAMRSFRNGFFNNAIIVAFSSLRLSCETFFLHAWRMQFSNKFITMLMVKCDWIFRQRGTLDQRDNKSD